MTSLRRAPHELIGLYWESGITNDVPALAWFLLSSLVPLALGLTALAAIVLGDYAQAQALASRVTRVLPKDVHDQVVQLILRTKQESPLLIAGSVGGMVWVSSGAVGVLERCFSRLLSRPGIGFVLGKVRNLAVAAGITTMIVMMVLVASAGTGVVQRLHLDQTLVRLAVPVVALALTVGVCVVINRVVGRGSLRWRASLAGAITSGAILLATPTLAGYYLRYVAGSSPVELFLMLSGVLVTCYLGALGLLLGAGVAARIQLGQRLGAPDPPPPAGRPPNLQRRAV